MTDKSRKALAELVDADAAFRPGPGRDQYAVERWEKAWANARAVLATAPAEPPKEHDYCREFGCYMNHATPAPSGEVAALIERRATLFEAIAHGDAEHRAWLKQAIDAHFRGDPIPLARLSAPRT